MGTDTGSSAADTNWDEAMEGHGHADPSSWSCLQAGRAGHSGSRALCRAGPEHNDLVVTAECFPLQNKCKTIVMIQLLLLF